MHISKSNILVLVAVLALLCCAPAAADSPANLTFFGTHRLRYESLHNGPRAEAPPSDEILVSRLLASLAFQRKGLIGQIELQDSRAWLHGTGTPLGTDDVNTLEPLQAWLGWAGSDELPLKIRAGRMTKEWRTRRLVARNRYRNTLNGFQGVDAYWTQDNWTLNAFALRSLARHPDNRPALEDNEASLDQPNTGQDFLGLEFRPAGLGDWSLYLLKLDEDQPAAGNTTARRITTVGGEWRQPLPDGRWFHAGEFAGQWGDITERQAASATVVDHRAWFAHLELGHVDESTMKREWVLSLDYASGDKPDPETHQRFDTLFGARRFEYGPSGIFAVEARSNLISPELRTLIQPSDQLELMAAWRGFWLDEATDIQTGTNYRQAGENPSRHVGQQLEARLRWNVDNHLQLETGAAWLDKGAVLRGEDFSAPGNSVYLYVATHLRW